MRWQVGRFLHRRKPTEYDLGLPLSLEPDIEHFLGEPTTTQEAERGCNLLQEPSVEKYEVLVEWRGCQLDTPDWWGELVAIPHIDDHQKLAQKIRASFEILWIRSKAQKVKNDYLLPPTPKCVGQKAFLLILHPKLPCQDYREGQLQKTLAYAQVLQYWAKKTNLPKPDQPRLLVRCIQKLRQAMRPFTTFTNYVVLERTTPKQGNLEEWARGPGMMEAPQTPMPEREPAMSPEKLTDPPAEELDVLAAALGEPAASLAGEPDIPPTSQETDKKKEVALTCEFPGWMQIHPSPPMTPVGQVPLSLCNIRQCHQSHNSSRRRAQDH